MGFRQGSIQVGGHLVGSNLRDFGGAVNCVPIQILF